MGLAAGLPRPWPWLRELGADGARWPDSREQRRSGSADRVIDGALFLGACPGPGLWCAPSLLPLYGLATSAAVFKLAAAGAGVAGRHPPERCPRAACRLAQFPEARFKCACSNAASRGWSWIGASCCGSPACWPVMMDELDDIELEVRHRSSMTLRNLIEGSLTATLVLVDRAVDLRRPSRSPAAAPRVGWTLSHAQDRRQHRSARCCSSSACCLRLSAVGH